MSYRDLYLSTQPKITNLSSAQKPVVTVFGVPYDATTSFRPGCRFGPDSIREAFWKIEVYDPELDVDGEKLPIDDLGNLNPMPETERMTEAVGRIVSELVKDGFRPAILGGEHSLTYGSFLQFQEDCQMIVFDAHFDLRDELYGRKMSHGTFLRRLSEKTDMSRFIHFGGRAASKEEWEIANSGRMKVMTTKQLNSSDYQENFRRLVYNADKIYVSLDLDIMDPAFAPGVGTPEPGGITSEKLLWMLRELKGKDIVGFDVVELDPPYDSSGITSIVAAAAFSTLASICSMKPT